jgi:peptidyl-prolyl cis-trans isomerase D
VLSANESKLRAMGGSDEDLARLKPELERASIDSLIAVALLAEEAERRGISLAPGALDDEMKKRASKPPPGVSDENFREVLGRELLAQKGLAALQDEVKMTDEDMVKAYKDALTTVDLAYALVPVGAPPKVSDEEAKDYAAKSKTEIEAYYKEHAAEYEEPAAVKARHILVKLKPRAAAAEEEAAKKKLTELSARLKAGEAFEAVARSSEDATTAASGGDLGWVSAGQMGKDFEGAAFALKPGEISPEVRTPFGLHLIKAEEKREAKTRALAEVEAEIARALVGRERAGAEAEKRAAALLETCAAGAALEVAAAGVGEPPLQVRYTGPFRPADEAVPGLGRDKDLVAAAFALTKESPLPKKPFRVGEAFVVFTLREREDADMAAYEGMKEQLRAQLLAAHQQAKLKTWLKERRDAEAGDIEINKAAIAGL